MDIVEIARDPKNLCQVQGCNTAPTCLCGLIEDMADEIERLREALKPFAKVLKGHWSHQSDDMILSIGFGDDKRLELKLGDFRLARATLKQKDSE